MYIRKSDDRGHARRGWLDSRFSFSFAEYHDPEHMGYSALRVINQDRIQAGTGFGAHGHRDMEIVTYVLSGELEHRDSMGHVSRVRPGDVQLMSAGTGVTHSEVNPSTTEQLHLLQMGDGAALDAGRLEIEAVQDAELILWDLPAAP